MDEEFELVLDWDDCDSGGDEFVIARWEFLVRRTSCSIALRVARWRRLWADMGRLLNTMKKLGI